MKSELGRHQASWTAVNSTDLTRKHARGSNKMLSMSWPNHERHCLALRIMLDIDPLNSHVSLYIWLLYLSLRLRSAYIY